MKNIIKVAAVAFLVCGASSAFAGKGGSAGAIQTAVASHSADAIIAKVSRCRAILETVH